MMKQVKAKLWFCIPRKTVTGLQGLVSWMLILRPKKMKVRLHRPAELIQPVECRCITSFHETGASPIQCPLKSLIQKENLYADILKRKTRILYHIQEDPPLTR